MGENNYDPEVLKRLELVRKQFRQHVREEKKQKASERRQDIFRSIGRNRIWIGRLITYVFLGVLLCAVIGVVVFNSISG